jgi:hypothetical protein
LAQAGIVFQACCRLHNYVIDQQVDCQLEPIEIAYESGGAVLGYFLAHCSHIALRVSVSTLEQLMAEEFFHHLH